MYTNTHLKYVQRRDIPMDLIQTATVRFFPIRYSSAFLFVDSISIPFLGTFLSFDKLDFEIGIFIRILFFTWTIFYDIF